jgi:RNA polymerase sigma-70 factor (ECF subfamily)
MEDAFLAGQVVSGNRVAFRMLVLRYQRPLFRFLGLLGFDAATVEDLAQQTFWRAYRALSSFDPERAAFSTWLFTIAKRLAASEHHRAHRRFEVEAAGDAPDGEPSAPPASDALLAAERAARVRGALAGLPIPLRSTFFLSQLEELTLEEVAEVEGCPLGTVKSRIHRARAYLRLALEPEET